MLLNGLPSAVPDGGGAALTIGCFYYNGSVGKSLNRRAFVYTSGTPAVGNVYSNNGSRFTVLYATGGVVHTWHSLGIADPLASGTLTLVSGTGGNSNYTSWTNPRVIPSIYINAGVPTPLGAGGATRYGLIAVYIHKNDTQTPTTAAPTPVYTCLASNAAYTSTASAIASLGTGATPNVSQFIMPPELLNGEPCLTGFVLVDGNTRIIPNTTSGGFVAGVWPFRTTPTVSGSGGSSSTVALASNVSTVTTDFTNILTSADINTQLALNTLSIGEHFINIVIGDGSSVIPNFNTGFSCPLPFSGVITGWSIAEVSSVPIAGSIEVDIYKSTAGAYPPTVSIAGTELPTLVTQKTNSDYTLTTWTTAVTNLDCFGFYVNSNTGCKKVMITIKVLPA